MNRLGLRKDVLAGVLLSLGVSLVVSHAAMLWVYVALDVVVEELWVIAVSVCLVSQCLALKRPQAGMGRMILVALLAPICVSLSGILLAHACDSIKSLRTDVGFYLGTVIPTLLVSGVGGLLSAVDSGAPAGHAARESGGEKVVSR